MTSPKEAYDNFYQQLVLLLEQVDKLKKLPIEKWPENFEERLAGLERMTEMMGKINQETLLNSGLTQEQIQIALGQQKDLPDWGRKFIEKMKKIKLEIETGQREAAALAVIMKQKQKLYGKKGSSSQARRKRFRRMGGKEDWKPL